MPADCSICTHIYWDAQEEEGEERPGSDVSGSECGARASRAIALQDQKLPSDLTRNIQEYGIWMAVGDENTPMGADIMLSTWPSNKDVLDAAIEHRMQVH